MENRCRVIEIITPKRYILNGLWFGGDTPKRAVIFVHGLTNSAFSNHDLIVPLVDKDTAVVTFGNRGHDKVAKIKKIDKRKKKGYTSELVGEAHEVFTDCIDDIQGVIDFISDKGVTEIYLAGHSTGCQKSVYYLAQRGKQKLVSGVILMCPMSDYAGALKFDKDGQLKKTEKVARKMVFEGRLHNLLPLDIWEDYHDAQRFLSLYTPESEEEIFCYVQPYKTPKTLRKVKIPTLVLLAGKDEYRDRPIKKIEKWFEKNLKSRSKKVVIVDNAPHNFKNYESGAVNVIISWLNSLM
ncbi:MAG: alpha/beta fold hydrolase [Patescibacteria group bacterium]